VDGSLQCLWMKHLLCPCEIRAAIVEFLLCGTHIVEFQLRLHLVLLVVAGKLVQHGSAASTSVVRRGRLGIKVAVGVWNTRRREKGSIADQQRVSTLHPTMFSQGLLQEGTASRAWQMLQLHQWYSTFFWSCTPRRNFPSTLYPQSC
jgi:hypothetical protein